MILTLPGSRALFGIGWLQVVGGEFSKHSAVPQTEPVASISSTYSPLPPLASTTWALIVQKDSPNRRPTGLGPEESTALARKPRADA